MSGGSRYVPTHDRRFPPDRSSPPRHDRYAPPSDGDYPSRSNATAGVASNRSSPAPRDVIRSSRTSDAPRPPSFAISSRGRGYSARGDHRGDPRDRPPPRIPRDSPPPYAGVRDRAWVHRDVDRRDRRPSPPRTRLLQGENRDFRDPPPRDIETAPARAFSRETSSAAPAPFRDGPSTAPFPQSRSAFGRGRGRADWDARDRGRDSTRDGDRPAFRARSRSPRAFRRSDDFDKARFDRQDDRRSDARDDDPALARDVRDRPIRDLPPITTTHTRPGSSSEIAPSTAHHPPATAGPSYGPRRAAFDQDRGLTLSRRGSSATTPASARDLRRESFKVDFADRRVDTTKDRYGSRASSPPSAPQVPAFGSVSSFKAPPAASGDLPWNVWRAQAPPAPPLQPAPCAPIDTRTAQGDVASNAEAVARQSMPEDTKEPDPVVEEQVAQMVAPATKTEYLRLEHESTTLPSNVQEHVPRPVPEAGPALATDLTKPPSPRSHSLQDEIVPPKAPKADREAQQTNSNAVTNPSTATSLNEKPKVIPTAPRAILAAAAAAQAPPIPLPPPPPPLHSLRRPLDSAKSPPTAPRQMVTMNSARILPRQDLPVPPPTAPKGPAMRSATRSPVLSAPIAPMGFRTLSTLTPPTTQSVNVPTGPSIPTGPKAERIQAPPSSSRAPNVPPAGPTWQWNRASVPIQALRVPAKRDVNGEEKRPPPSQAAPIPATADMGMMHNDRRRRFSPEPQHYRPRSTEGKAKVLPRVNGDEAESTKASEEVTSIGAPLQSLVEDEDPMDLDEGDFAGNEAKFQREIELLEAKKVDLSCRHLRGSTPIERLAFLDSMLYLDIDFTSANERSKIAEPEMLLTPKVEDEDVILTAAVLPMTPEELRALPYLQGEPLTPLSESEVLRSCIVRHERSKDAILQLLRQSITAKSAETDTSRDQYRQLYKPWKRYCEELDKEMINHDDGERTQASMEPEVGPTPIESNTTVTALGNAESRRGRALASEYDIQRAMQESLLSEIEAQARRDRESLKVRPDTTREAILPEILSAAERKQRIIVDHTCLRDAGDALAFYEFFPSRDDFSGEEHKIVVNGFKDYPKKFGKLAEALPGRTYKDVINHYYTTKWAKEFKPPKDKRRKANKKPRNVNAPTNRKSNALISNLGNGVQPEVYDGGEFGTPIVSITDSGRPRRAAAPTFGDKESEDMSANATPARRSVKSDLIADSGVEKPARRPRAAGREKSQKKLKPVVAVQQSYSPQKLERMSARPAINVGEPSDSTRQDMEIAQELANSQSQVQAFLPQISQDRTELPRVYTTDTYPAQAAIAAEMENRDMVTGQQTRAGTTSYWSVQEVNLFPQLLAHFGTDWQSIAIHMGSKTQTMIKNYYFRLINSNNRPDIEEVANQANARRDRGDASGFSPTPSLSVKRRVDLLQPMVPRPHAHSMEVVDVDASSPSATQARSVPYVPDARHQQPQTFPFSQLGGAQASGTSGSLTLTKPFLAQSTQDNGHSPRHADREADLSYRPTPAQPRADVTSSLQRPQVDSCHDDRGLIETNRSWQVLATQEIPPPPPPPLVPPSHTSYKPDLNTYRQEFSQQFARPSSSSGSLDHHYDRYGSRVSGYRAIPTPPRLQDTLGSANRLVDLAGFRSASSQSAPNPDHSELHQSSVVKDGSLHNSRSTQPHIRPLAAASPSSLASAVPTITGPPRQEPRKTSNLLSLLNSDSDAPKGPRFLSSSIQVPPPRIQTPPQAYQGNASTLQHPLSQVERRDEARPSLYQPVVPYTQGNYAQSMARHTPTLSAREAPLPAGPRGTWPPRGVYTPSQSGVPSPYDAPKSIYANRPPYQQSPLQNPVRRLSRSTPPPPAPYPQVLHAHDVAMMSSTHSQQQHSRHQLGANPYAHSPVQHHRSPSLLPMPQPPALLQQDLHQRQDFHVAAYGRRGSDMSVPGMQPHAHHLPGPFRELQAGGAHGAASPQPQLQAQQPGGSSFYGVQQHARNLSHERMQAQNGGGAAMPEPYGRRPDLDRGREAPAPAPAQDRDREREYEREREREQRDRSRWAFGGGAYGPR